MDGYILKRIRCLKPSNPATNLELDLVYFTFISGTQNRNLFRQSSNRSAGRISKVLS